MTINPDTLVYAIIGNPVSQSLSPAMHNSAFLHTRIPAVYLAFNVSDIKSAIQGLRALGIKGVSVTVPHKTAVIPFLAKIDKTARKIEAVNTILNKNGFLCGYNTDCIGAEKALLEHTSIQGKTTALIGAGGAAKAIAHAIISRGGNLTIFSRSESSGKKLAQQLGAEFRPISQFSAPQYQIIINSTSCGMSPNHNSSPVNLDSVHKDTVVMDIVYKPLQTLFLQQAKAKGCKTIDGISMLLFQGAAQFELWTGKKAPLQVMKQAILKT